MTTLAVFAPAWLHPSHALVSELHTFIALLLRDVLCQAEPPGRHVDSIARNGNRSIMPIEDSVDFDVVIACLMDSEPVPVRNKGPLFILYPFDQVEDIRSPIYYGRSVWQLKARQVR